MAALAKREGRADDSGTGVKRFNVGLVVGKFAPLHRGHCLTIDTCMAQSEMTVIISWSNPEFDGYDADRRRSWLEATYPDAVRMVVDQPWLDGLAALGVATPSLPENDAPERESRDFVGWLCKHVLGVRVDAVFTSEAYGPGFAADLSPWFDGAHVVHIAVDPARAALPISGTAIRADPLQHLAWLPGPVAASFVRRVVALGGESSGKSTLCVALAEALGTISVAEYGRELWDLQCGTLHYPDLLHIAQEQIRREEQACTASEVAATGVLICDTSPLTTWLYCREMFGRYEPELAALATRAYDLTVLCAPDFAFVQDGTRRDPSFRDTQHAWYLDELAERAVSPLLIVSGPVSERVSAVCQALNQLAAR
jgi:HTH-type transcriptional regulator, transcriptional repressor of NAD biosynthesis genes